MSLYDTPSNERGASKTLTTAFGGGGNGVGVLLLLGYLFLINLIEIVLDPIVIGGFWEDPPSIVSWIISVGLLLILAAYAFGKVSANWPILLVAVLSLLRAIAFFFAKSETVALSSGGKITFFKLFDINQWIGSLCAFPTSLLYQFGFLKNSMPELNLRMYWVANYAVVFLICLVLLYFRRKHRN